MRRSMVENIFGQMRPHGEALAFFKDRFKSWPDDWTQLENSVWRDRGAASERFFHQCIRIIGLVVFSQWSQHKTAFLN